MALKPVILAKLNSLNSTAQILRNLGHDDDVIKEQLASGIRELEEEAKCKLELNAPGEGDAFTLVDLKSDFVRTRYNGDAQTQLALRTKIFGLPIEVKVWKLDKDGAVEFKGSNEQVAAALVELAAVVAAMPEEMIAKGHADWSRTPGEVAVETNDLDEGEEGNTPISEELPESSGVVDETKETHVDDLSALPGESMDAEVSASNEPAEAPVSLA